MTDLKAEDRGFIKSIIFDPRSFPQIADHFVETIQTEKETFLTIKDLSACFAKMDHALEFENGSRGPKAFSAIFGEDSSLCVSLQTCKQGFAKCLDISQFFDGNGQHGQKGEVTLASIPLREIHSALVRDPANGLRRLLVDKLEGPFLKGELGFYDLFVKSVHSAVQPFLDNPGQIIEDTLDSVTIQ